jgi:hypothetical protein
MSAFAIKQPDCQFFIYFGKLSLDLNFAKVRMSPFQLNNSEKTSGMHVNFTHRYACSLFSI